MAALPSTGPRKASKEQRRQQLIDATMTIARKGYAALTLADVAKAAGLSGGIVNFHFESKEKLLVATLRHLAEEYRLNWQTALKEAGPSPAARLAALATADFNDVVCTPVKLAAWSAFWAEARTGRPTWSIAAPTTRSSTPRCGHRQRDHCRGQIWRARSRSHRARHRCPAGRALARSHHLLFAGVARRGDQDRL